MDAEARANAWDELLSRGDPGLSEHPMRQIKNWKRRAIGLSLHGDAAPVLQVGKAATKSYDTWSIASFLCSRLDAGNQ